MTVRPSLRSFAIYPSLENAAVIVTGGASGIGMLPAFVRDGNRAVFTCRALDIGAGLSSPEVLVPQAEVQPLSADQIREFLRHYASEHAEATFARITTDERQLTLYNTPFFLDLLVRQIRPDGTLPASRAALFAGFIRAALQREITARSFLFVEEEPDALLQERDRAWLHRPPRGTAPHELPSRGPLIGRLSALAFAMVFADGTQYELASLSGDSSSGYAASLTIGVNA